MRHNFGLHEPLIEKKLRKYANKYTEVLKNNNDIVGVILAGSVGRGGPVTASSDLDLYVFTKRPDDSIWEFTKDNIQKDIHKFDLNCIKRCIDATSNKKELALWFYESKLGDLLDQSETLYWSNEYSHLEKEFKKSLEFRHDARVKKYLVSLFLASCMDIIRLSEQAINKKAFFTAHQNLKWGVQELLVASLITAGWTIKGLKKRPEIASTYSNNKLVESSLSVFDKIMGISSISKQKSIKMSQQRFAIRKYFHKELASLLSLNLPDTAINRLTELNELQLTHDSNSFNYYLPQIEQAGCKGVVNHIQAISGFSYIPSRVMSCFDDVNNMTVIDNFINCPYVTKDFKNLWLEIAMLESNKQSLEVMISMFKQCVLDIECAI